MRKKILLRVISFLVVFSFFAVDLAVGKKKTPEEKAEMRRKEFEGFWEQKEAEKRKAVEEVAARLAKEEEEKKRLAEEVAEAAVEEEEAKVEASIKPKGFVGKAKEAVEKKVKVLGLGGAAAVGLGGVGTVLGLEVTEEVAPLATEVAAEVAGVAVEAVGVVEKVDIVPEAVVGKVEEKVKVVTEEVKKVITPEQRLEKIMQRSESDLKNAKETFKNDTRRIVIVTPEGEQEIVPSQYYEKQMAGVSDEYDRTKKAYKEAQDNYRMVLLKKKKGEATQEEVDAAKVSYDVAKEDARKAVDAVRAKENEIDRLVMFYKYKRSEALPPESIMDSVSRDFAGVYPDIEKPEVVGDFLDKFSKQFGVSEDEVTKGVTVVEPAELTEEEKALFEDPKLEKEMKKWEEGVPADVLPREVPAT